MIATVHNDLLAQGENIRRLVDPVVGNLGHVDEAVHAAQITKVPSKAPLLLPAPPTISIVAIHARDPIGSPATAQPSHRATSGLTKA